MGTSFASTRGVEVTVISQFVAERSNPNEGMWFFAYHIQIANQGEESVQLLSRHWVITDAHGRVEEVQGPGVVGAQPVLAPGESFHYASACPLSTPFGTMQGTYQMVTQSGSAFDAEVAAFALSVPYAVN